MTAGEIILQNWFQICLLCLLSSFRWRDYRTSKFRRLKFELPYPVTEKTEIFKNLTREIWDHALSVSNIKLKKKIQVLFPYGI